MQIVHSDVHFQHRRTVFRLEPQQPLRVRGFTRDIEGKKLFMDHNMTSIQDFIDPATLDRYDAYDINVYQANLFHTRMLLKEIDLQNYLFNTDIYELPPKTRLKIHSDLRREMIEIFSGKNIY